jgi:ribosome-dependent ATPase
VVKTAGVDESIHVFEGRAKIFESQDSAVKGILADEVKPGVREAAEALRRTGVDRVAMLTGDNEAIARETAMELGLERFLDRKAGNLSGGMMQKLSLVCTLLAKPSLLLLDEPTTGVDPVSRKELWEIIRGLVRSEGIICVASTAYMGEASTFDRLLLFDKGEIISTGDFDSLVGSVADFTYADDGILRDGSIAINGFLYALGSLELPKKEPNLESVFFVRSLKEGRTIPKIHFSNDGENGDFSSKTVLKALSLTKKFGQFVANDSVSLDLNSGEILGLIGANGAGKTTFIKMLLGQRCGGGGRVITRSPPLKFWMLCLSLKCSAFGM